MSILNALLLGAALTASMIQQNRRTTEDGRSGKKHLVHLAGVTQPPVAASPNRGEYDSRPTHPPAANSLQANIKEFSPTSLLNCTVPVPGVEEFATPAAEVVERDFNSPAGPFVIGERLEPTFVIPATYAGTDPAAEMGTTGVSNRNS